MTVPATRLRNWVFTMFDTGPEAIAKLKKLHEDGIAKYLIVGEEVCPDTKKEHLQGYVEFKILYSFKRVKEILGDKVHIEPRTATAVAAAEYCRKEGKYHEFGAPPKARGQGKRTDFDVVRQELSQGSCLRDIILKASSYQSIRYAEKVLQYMEPRRDWEPVIIWAWGDTGVGKSSLAHFIAPEAWWAGNSLRWWQGYDGQPDVVFDNFTSSFVPITELLRILDRFPYTVECKGSSRQLLAHRYIITSVKPPDAIYSDSQVPELMRRIRMYGTVIHLTGKEKVDDFLALRIAPPSEASEPPPSEQPEEEIEEIEEIEEEEIEEDDGAGPADDSSDDEVDKF